MRMALYYTTVLTRRRPVSGVFGGRSQLSDEAIIQVLPIFIHFNKIKQG